jgi:alpha-tubulin suppressor-like RCC1 family protein
LRSGGAKCWGDNFDGALGDGSHEPYSNVPVTVKGLAGTASLVSGVGYCALSRSGRARCWGDDGHGALGDGGHGAYSNTPVIVKGLAGAVSLASEGDGYCALLRSGRAKCWGDNFDGALGDGSHEPYSNVPVTVKGLVSAVSVVSEGYAYCVLLRSGRAKCWGENYDGSLLGNGGHEAYSNIPVTVKGLAGASSLVSEVPFDIDGLCALLRNGEAKCWGENENGALGDGGHESYSNVPVPVKGLGT